MDDPSCRRVKDKLEAAGYVAPSFRTIAQWAKQGSWQGRREAPPRDPAKVERNAARRRAKRALADSAAVLTGDPTTTVEDIVRDAERIVAPPPPPPADAAGGDQPASEIADPEQEEHERARARLRALRDAIHNPDATDEFLLTEAARRSLQAAIVISALLAEMAPALIAANPEAVGKLQIAVAESLAAAGEPFDRVGAARERAMKTISSGGTVIEPGAGDPLADQIVAFKSRHAA